MSFCFDIKMIKTVPIFVSHKDGFYLHPRMVGEDRFDFEELNGPYNPSSFGFNETAMCCVYETHGASADQLDTMNMLFIMFAKVRLGIPINASFLTGEVTEFSETFRTSVMYRCKAVIRDNEKCYHYHNGVFTEMEDVNFVAGRYGSLFMKYLEMGIPLDDIAKNIVGIAVGLGFNRIQMKLDYLAEGELCLDIYRQALTLVETYDKPAVDTKRPNLRNKKKGLVRVCRIKKKTKPSFQWRPKKNNWPRIETMNLSKVDLP